MFSTPYFHLSELNRVDINGLFAVIFGHAYVYYLAQRSGDVLAYEICSYRKFAVTAVYHYDKLDALGTACVHKRLDGSTNGAAGKENVIYKDDLLAF